MKRIHLSLLMAGLAVLPLLSSADTVVEEIIARVNNSIITRSDFERSKEQLKDEIKQQDRIRIS
jgi:sulfur carrier protein ThiS